MDGFTYTPGEVGTAVNPGGLHHADPLLDWKRGTSRMVITDEDRVEAERRYNLALSWKPPAGHTSWCEMQLPPVWRHSHVGSTPMAARGGCTCGRSKVTRTLRRVNEREARPTTVAA